MLRMRLLLLLFFLVGVACLRAPKAKDPYWLEQAKWITPRRNSGQDILDRTYEEVVNYNVRTGTIRRPQLQARHDFLDLYQSHLSNGPLTEEQMYPLFEELDRYFFLGALTQGEMSFVDLKVIGDLGNKLGYTHAIVGDMPRQLMKIARTLRGEEISKVSQLCTLTHEMVHAYVFVYWVGGIWGDKKHVLGPYGDGHGDVFWQLWKPIVYQLRTWDSDLIQLCEKPDYKGYGPLDRGRLQAYYERKYGQNDRKSVLVKWLLCMALLIPFLVGLIILF